MDMKNVQTFNEFVNESYLNEGKLASAIATENPVRLPEYGDVAASTIKAVEKYLGTKVSDILILDPEDASDIGGSTAKAFGYLEKSYKATDSDDTDDAQLGYDKKLNIVQIRFHGADPIYAITTKSKL